MNTNLIVSITDKAVRVHRATCKRAPQHSLAVEAVINGSTGTREAVQMAKPASCCKPRTEDVQELIDAVVESIRNDRLNSAPAVLVDKFAALTETAPSAPEEDEYQDYLAESDGEEGEGEEDYAAVEVDYKDSGVAKHYWKVYGREAAQRVAEMHGVKVRAAAAYARFTGPEDAVNDAVHALKRFWETGAADFAEWRKNDPSYLAVKASDKGRHWFKSARAAAEFEKLRGLIEDLI